MLSYDCRNVQRLYIIFVVIGLLSSLAHAGFPKFEYHQIARIGNKMGQTSLVDVDKDGDLDWIAGCNGGTIWWFEYKSPDNWVKHTLGQKAPTGDGDNDVVRTNIWYENADGKGTEWVEHNNIDFGQPLARFPLMTKSWVVDIDKDGDNDIIQAEGDCVSGRVAWHENADGKGRIWTRHIIADKAGQDFHSLAVADFDNDGDLDVFSGGGPLTESPPHKWFIWENKDGRGIRWVQHEILSGKRCHEAKAADVDGDGDIDICSKPCLPAGRFWATPDKPSPARQTLWRELLSNGVDLLNTDDLRGLQQFLLQYTPK